MIPQKVKLVEVGPRDGLQNEKQYLEPAVRSQLIQLLAQSGLKMIECGSFVSNPKIPPMKHTDEVLRSLGNLSNLSFDPMVLVPNEKGFEEAMKAQVRHIAVFSAVSESFNERNVHASINESFNRMRAFMPQALSSGVWIRGYISCVWGCPYEGEIKFEAVWEMIERLMELGCHEISLGDTIGVATPFKVRVLLEQLEQRLSLSTFAVHFHDTYGQALANIWEALQHGIEVIDSSVAGLGGCPYAKGASGNVATEDVLYLLHGAGIETGVDLERVIQAGTFIGHVLNRPTRSKVAEALARP